MDKKKRPLNLAFIGGFWVVFLLTVACYAEKLQPPLSKLIAHGGFIVTSNNKILAEHNSDSIFVPASTIKLATALIALEVLGPDYRFKTDFFLNNQSHLYIKGYGDPFLTSEYIEKIAEKLKTLGLNRVDQIIIDDSSFALLSPADGSLNSKKSL